MTMAALGGVAQHTGAPRAATLLADSCPVAGSVTVFHVTGSEQCFTVPPAVYQIEAQLIGGFGGTGYNPTSEASSLGGNGAIVQAVITVTPGQVIYVDVGTPGAPGGTLTGAGTGGFNGGGNGGTSALTSGSPPAAGGGGATDFRTEPSAGCGTSPAAIASLASRILVAGGGGGGGESNGNSGSDGGGRGGPAQGGAQPGTDGQLETTLDGKGGGAGTETAPGTGGAAAATGTAGAAGTSGCGGDGGNGTGGGGGGGGYFGGGGGGGGAEGAAGSGAGGGGGGGANYADPLLTCDAFSGNQLLASSRTGPQAVIEYPVRDPCPKLDFVPDVSSGGFVADVVGSGWTPGAPITFTWRELGSLPADVVLTTITPATASFSLPIVLMTHDEIGQRVIVADQFKTGYSNSAGLLVAASPEEPPTFLFRR